MTYVVGISSKDFGVNAIISDTRCSAKDKVEGRESPVVKNGLLFPGCMYGAAGVAAHILHFVEFWDRHFESCTDARECWEEFEAAIEKLRFSANGRFRMLLSSNASGEPALYLLDPASKRKLTRIQGKSTVMESIGSGKKILDDGVIAYLSSREARTFGKSRPEHYAYGLCARLMYHARGLEAHNLEKYEVGGYFNFWLQTATVTQPQKKCLYVACHVKQLKKPTLFTEFSRIGCQREGEFSIIEILDTSDDYNAHIVVAPTNSTLAELGFRGDEASGSLLAGGIFHLSQYNTDNEVFKRIGDQFREPPLYDFCSVFFDDQKYPFAFNHFRENDSDGYWLEAAEDGVPNAIQHPFVSNMLMGIIGMQLELGASHDWPEKIWEDLSGAPAMPGKSFKCYELNFVGDP